MGIDNQYNAQVRVFIASTKSNSGDRCGAVDRVQSARQSVRIYGKLGVIDEDSQVAADFLRMLVGGVQPFEQRGPPPRAAAHLIRRPRWRVPSLTPRRDSGFVRNVWLTLFCAHLSACVTCRSAPWFEPVCVYCMCVILRGAPWQRSTLS